MKLLVQRTGIWGSRSACGFEGDCDRIGFENERDLLTVEGIEQITCVIWCGLGKSGDRVEEDGVWGERKTSGKIEASQ
ncbi:hypothetical protein Q2T42_19710 [Leptolyngbya boryana CZ1]|uniref:Uncharacterized protein n=1 Tax=Leptolyngbya boryana CZ1 TaxID=3060204 RepID=A0AA97AMB3_LEPBY|nr:hypothetical protein [Leptolyngbya boryana]WNZ44062.1 hypothetical protein Q2T42_19710 [Leptolyngbya boryana CZ1]